MTCVAVLTAHRRLTDRRIYRRTDGHTAIAYTALAQRRAVKTSGLLA